MLRALRPAQPGPAPPVRRPGKREGAQRQRQQEGVEARGDPDRLSPEELKGLLNKPELLSVTERHTPSQAVAFWLPEAELEALELELGTEIRLKTRGDSPFILSLAKLQAGTVTHCHVVGDGQAGASWTEHVLAHRAQGGPGPEPRGQGDGAEEDEWDA
ncbi:arpin isoform X2 [Pelodiscus sinensis]|uniref:arpin isoform X2 n=1 Tax=Pelodiscus sinensis TaxID=13735 RepID=UPI003F6A5A79